MLTDGSTLQARVVQGRIHSSFKAACTSSLRLHRLVADGAKLQRLGVNLGGVPWTASARASSNSRSALHAHSDARGVRYPLTSGTDAYTPPSEVEFTSNCDPQSPSALCDKGVYVGEHAAGKSGDFAVQDVGGKLETSYNTGVSPVRELGPNTLGGDFFGHIGDAPITKEQVQELMR